MKVFILVDMEGISGICLEAHTTGGTAEYEMARRWMTQDVNAAVQGALDGGASEIVVADGHGTNGMYNLVYHDLHEGASYIEGSPRDYGHRRPTWTQELLIRVLAERTGITVSRTTMCRLLRRLGIRRGMPKPIVGCPWSPRARQRRLRLIRRLLETLPPDQAVVFEDEIDVHLNSKVGPDSMNPGQQKQVVTPGQNVKRYVAGALDARTDRLIWVAGNRKRSALFIALLHKLDRQYAEKKIIHVILDNYVIHTSRITRDAAEAFRGRIVLHFLPPYCPDDNRIERCVWRELHANVTRNHTCETIDELMEEVHAYLIARNRRAAARRRRKAA